MLIRKNGFRFDKYKTWGVPPDTTYDYMKNGIIKHMFSNKIANSKNQTLNIILDFFEQSIIFLLRYIDELKHFIDFNSKNR